MKQYFTDRFVHMPLIYIMGATAAMIICAGCLFNGCIHKRSAVEPDAAFTKYISSFTSGEISVESPVSVQLTDIPENFKPGETLPSGLFTLQPEAEGETVMNSGGLIQFKPGKPFRPGTAYVVNFNLYRLMKVDNPCKKFRFSFSTIPTDFKVSGEGLMADASLNSEIMTYSGTVLTSDATDPSLVEQLVTATFDDRKVKLLWVHTPDRRRHVFSADSLVRHKTQKRELVISWDGNPLKINNKGKNVIPVPSMDEFLILNITPQTLPEQQVTVTFSDPLDLEQDLAGMAEIAGGFPFTWQIDGNRLIMWPVQEITGKCQLTFYKGLRGSGGKILHETSSFPVHFRNMKPEIRLLGKGVIVPDQGNLYFPFEAVSLKAVDLRIIRIYPSNVRQFLQDNQVDGNDNIKKVGRLAYSGKVDLKPDDPDKLNQWNTYRIDLNKYVTPEQGSIYRIELRFNKAYSLYECPENAGEPEPDEIPAGNEDWDSPGWYDLYYWPENYDWKEKDNPCHISYYTSQRFCTRNILASDMGIVAKEGKGFRFTFAVTSLMTTQPVENAEIELYDYQLQLMGKTTTGNEGFATIALMKKPFVAVAKKGNQTGYLRIDDGSSLSMSNFDVSGEEIQEGLKGFLYGERGVWRPGDQLYLTFILDDPGQALPENTPVIFRLINSRGQEAVRRVATVSENGFYSFPVTTRPEDPTGNWYARVQVGGATFEKRIKIETVKPNRLKVEMKLPDPIRGGVRQSADLAAVWLHGAPAPNLKAIVEAEMFPAKTIFKGYEKYIFDNPCTQFSPSKQTVFEGRLDEKGRTVVPLEFPGMSSAPGKLKAWFTTRVFEEGGDFSIQVSQTGFSPFSGYLGIRMPEEEDGWYQTGKTYQPEIISLSPDGKPSPMGKVEVSLYKIDWKWWWESGEDYLAHYVSGSEYKPVKTWKLGGLAGQTAEKIALNVQYRNWRDNGRYLLYARDLRSGHATGVTFYMSEWGGWRTDALPDGATMLSLRTDKEKYTPGEKIKVSIPSSASGRALVSLEDGKQVRQVFWVMATDNETSFNIDVKPGMAPTLYIYVTLLQPYGSTQNDAPIRLYGVKAVSIEDPATLLAPVIRMNDELEPEKEFRVKISEEKGKPMTYTLAIVDEGLLDITGFRTPDPHAHFYAREALGVKTYDLFDYVAGAYGALLESAFAVGGDQDVRIAGQKQANRFQPVVLFDGPYTLPKNGSKSHTLKMPNYVGSVKAMVIAGNEGAYGSSEKPVKVRKAVMLLATLPRLAGPGEEMALPVSVFAMKETTRDVTIVLETNDLIKPSGEKLQKLVFSGPGEKMAWFTIKTAVKTGVAKIKLVATSGNETATFETGLEIRNPNPPVTVDEEKILQPGQKWSPTLSQPGMPGTNQSHLELSSIPGLNLSHHLEDLIDYPHGCCEQTVSAGFCQLNLENLVGLTDAEKSEAESNIREAIRKLQGLQTGNGGFALWPGQNQAHDWSTSYAGHFLMLAAKKGFQVPADMKNRWITYQVTAARQWKPAAAGIQNTSRHEAVLQAYRLYSLALAGSPERGVMNRFREEVAGNNDARLRLAAAFILSGQASAGKAMIRQSQFTAENYPDYGPTFGSTLRDKAMIVETLLLDNDMVKAYSLVKEMAEEINQASWLSTQTAAWCFYTLSEYFRTQASPGEIDAGITMNGNTKKQHSKLPVVKIPVGSDKNNLTGINVVNTGKSTLYVRISSRGIPLEDRFGSVQNNLSIRTLFTDRNGNIIDPATLPGGSDFFITISVSHPGIRGPYNDLVLTSIFPSGWEILNSRLNDIPQSVNQQYDYQDIRDDRVYTYFNLRNSESKTFRLALHAAYSGRFYLPAQVCEAMYDNTVRARVPGQWVTVVKQNQ